MSFLSNSQTSVAVTFFGSPTPIVSEMPHGGYKASGFGKDMSMYSFEEYTQVKHVSVDVSGVARKEWHRTIFRNPGPDRVV